MVRPQLNFSIEELERQFPSAFEDPNLSEFQIQTLIPIITVSFACLSLLEQSSFANILIDFLVPPLTKASTPGRIMLTEDLFEANKILNSSVKLKTESNCCDANSIEFSNKITFIFTSFGSISTVNWALRFKPWALDDMMLQCKVKLLTSAIEKLFLCRLQQANLDDLKLMRHLV